MGGLIRPCLVLGGADCVWADVEAALDQFEFGGVVACNDVGALWAGPLAAWVSLHPEKMAGWIAKRARRGHPPVRDVVSIKDATGVTRIADFKWPEMRTSGSSGLYATKIALEQFTHVVLCGVPMTPTPHFFDKAEWRVCAGFRQAWDVARPRIRGSVRSMSGWTAKRLGTPDMQWISSVASPIELPSGRKPGGARVGRPANRPLAKEAMP